MSLSDLLNKYDLGYLFYLPRRDSEPGHPRVDILFGDKPSGKHFDPARMEMPVRSQHQGVDYLTVEHPWHGDDHYHVCAGQLDLEDHKGRTVEMFSFGGEVEITASETHSLCIYRSPAPIMVNYFDRSPATLITEEVEILLAQRRADLRYQPGEYERRLSVVDPFDLYLACLNALVERFRQLPPSEDDIRIAVISMIGNELETANQGRGTGLLPVPKLGQIL